MSKYDRHRYPCSYVRSGAISISAGRWPGGWSFSFAAFLQTATQQSGYRCLQDMARDLMDIKRKHRDIKGVFCVNEPMPFRLTGSAWMI